MSKAQAEKVGSRVTRVILNDKSVTFRCTSNAAGQDVRDIIVNAFEPKDVTRYNYDLEWLFTLGMSEWQEFRAKFDNSTDTEDCYNEVKAAITAYQNTSTDSGSGTGSGSGSGGGGGNTDTTVTTNSKDWTTYIIIGAAVAVILLLLWDRKKK